ncbi:MAG: hypothetical protein V1929_01035 [bacterium]
MNTDIDPLKKALATWRDIEPRQGFEDAVWRRIEARPEQAASPFRAFIELLTARPAWAACAGVAAGVLIGLALTGRPASASEQFALLGSDSLASNYIQLATGYKP